MTGQQLWKQVYNTLGGNPRSTSAATCTRRHYEKWVKQCLCICQADRGWCVLVKVLSDRCVICAGCCYHTNAMWKAYHWISCLIISQSTSSLLPTAKKRMIVRYQQNARCYHYLCIRLVLFNTQKIRWTYLSFWSGLVLLVFTQVKAQIPT